MQNEKKFTPDEIIKDMNKWGKRPEAEPEPEGQTAEQKILASLAKIGSKKR